MIHYLLDTMIVSELRRFKPHGAVLEWINSLPATVMFISAVTMGELQRGIERTRQHDLQKALAIEQWANDVPQRFQVLAMDTACFREWARLMKGKNGRPWEDVMIAATARVHGLTVATRNGRDFAGLVANILNPFEYRSSGLLQ